MSRKSREQQEAEAEQMMNEESKRLAGATDVESKANTPQEARSEEEQQKDAAKEAALSSIEAERYAGATTEALKASGLERMEDGTLRRTFAVRAVVGEDPVNRRDVTEDRGSPPLMPREVNMMTAGQILRKHSDAAALSLEERHELERELAKKREEDTQKAGANNPSFKEEQVQVKPKAEAEPQEPSEVTCPDCGQKLSACESNHVEGVLLTSDVTINGRSYKAGAKHTLPATSFGTWKYASNLA